MDKQLFRNAIRYKKIQAAIFLFVIFCIPPTIAQQKDTLYVQEYPHKWWIKTFVPNKKLIMLLIPRT